MYQSLNGEWTMTYTREVPGRIDLPGPDAFTSSLPVPGIWDDFAAQFVAFNPAVNPDHREIEFPLVGDKIPDGSLPFIEGTVWLRRTVQVREKSGFVRIGGVRLEAWVWWDGRFLGHHLGHSTGFEFPLPADLLGSHELTVAVSNLRRDRSGCDLRGFAGRSGGITRAVSLVTFDRALVRDLYVYAEEDLSTLQAEARLAGDLTGAELHWEIGDRENESLFVHGRIRIEDECTRWSVPRGQLPAWSDDSPHLLEARVVIRYRDGTESLPFIQWIGLRRLVARGTGLQLNGHPVFLRGATEHAYFPETTVPPTDPATCRQMVKALKDLGFNWLRFHTWVPPDEYLDVTDALGMLVQVEPPVGAGKSEWEAILRTVRRHPSVVIICAGNEELLDEQKIALLEGFAGLVKSLAPDLLFNPQEGLRGVEYGRSLEDPADLATPVVRVPFLHNPSRLKQLHTFSDVFGHFPRGLLSYQSSRGDWREIESALAVYERPCLAHELGIHGSYLDFSLASRHGATRAGDRVYRAAEGELERSGFAPRAAELHRLSCAWMQLLRKHSIENARHCQRLAGYDLLGATDVHWHRYGYPCGILNEFYEIKPGETAADVHRYNGPTVLLLDLGLRRNFAAGASFSSELTVSHFDHTAGSDAHGFWEIVDSSGVPVVTGKLLRREIRPTGRHSLGTIQATLPVSDRPQKLTVRATLHFADRPVDNQWNLWVFPPPPVQNGTGMKIISELDDAALRDLEAGGRALLLGPGGLPARPVSFQISVAGRANGNLALPVHPHPLWKDFPHDGFCDWQFHPLIEGAQAVDFTDLREEFQPLLEVVSSFKRIIPQAAVFEWRVGRGRLLVCGLQLPDNNPGAAWLRGGLIQYLNGPEFGPPPAVDPDRLRRLIKLPPATDASLATDMGFDDRGQLPRT